MWVLLRSGYRQQGFPREKTFSGSSQERPGTNPALHLVSARPQEVPDVVVHVGCRGGINAEIKIENKNTECRQMERAWHNYI